MRFSSIHFCSRQIRSLVKSHLNSSRPGEISRAMIDGCKNATARDSPLFSPISLAANKWLTSPNSRTPWLLRFHLFARKIWLPQFGRLNRPRTRDTFLMEYRSMYTSRCHFLALHRSDKSKSSVQSTSKYLPFGQSEAISELLRRSPSK